MQVNHCAAGQDEKDGDLASQQSVGRRRPVSERTIERIWQGREREKG
jgi:hypothetical protein